MNRLAKRAYFAYFLAAAMAIGVLIITFRYFYSGPSWVPYKNNGKIVDRNGVMLMDYSNGRSELADHPTVRKAMLQILGDLEGNIPRRVINYHSSSMMGFDLINGTHHAGNGYGTMEMTLSAKAQKAAVDALGGYHGTIGVYNYETGEILCMVSTPTFDPRNVPDVNGNPEEYDAVYTHRFIHSTYTPGSTFKLVTAAAALEEIDEIESRSFHCTGTKMVGDEEVICNGVHGDIDFQEALRQSCNIAFAEIAAELGADTMLKYVNQFGITESLEFDGFKTKAGSVDLENATVYETGVAGFGQHNDLVNPCQYMYFMGAIANGGKAAKPYLVKRITFDGNEKYKAKVEFGDSLMSSTSADALASMMHYTVKYQYGEWFFNGLYAGAKSGTAQRGDGQTANALFAGFVQDEDYPLAFVVVAEGGNAGATTCAPMIQQVLYACMTSIDED